MTTLADKLERSRDFLIGVELVSTRGIVADTRASKTVDFARDLAACSRIDWVSITDNEGGHPMLAAS